MYFMAIGDVYKLHMESIAPGGDALGRFDGKPVFVEGGAPDEIVCCRITDERKTWARAELLEIIEPSTSRVESACAFYGKCGGCNLQHIDYDTQLAVKAAILKDSLLRIGGLQPPGLTASEAADSGQCSLMPEVFSSPPWEYRNRMQFHCFRQNVQKDCSLKFGLMGRRSGEIIAVSDCPVAAPKIREHLRSGGNGILLPPEKDRFTVFSKDEVLLNEGGQCKGKIKLLEKEIVLDAGVFFQSNCFMLEKLILELQKIAEDVGIDAGQNAAMADLYCGVGTFAVFLGEVFPKLILAEENKSAVSLARENLRRASAEFFALRDTDWQRAFLRQRAAFGFAVVDPPRAGLAPKLAAALAQDGPPVLAYVSCDPASLARDAKILINGGYGLNKLMLFDFYPQTAHIESLAVFER